MTNISVYYDVYKSAFVYNTTGKPLTIEDYPVIRYKEYKTIEWNIGYWNNSTLAFTAIDLTAFNVTAWQSALDYDFSTGTDPMIVSSNSMIDSTDAATGKIVVTYDADNSDFLAAVNGQSNGARYCYIDLNGVDASAHNVFSASPTNVQVIAKMQIAPGADPSGPSASLYYTKSETDGLLGAKMGYISTLTEKTAALVNADQVGIADSEAANVSKKTLWSTIKSTLKTYFDTLYQAILTSNSVKANYLQNTPTDLGAANVTVDLSNSNGSYVTNLTTDGTITTASMKYTNSAMFGTAINTNRGVNCSLSVTDPANGLSGMYAEIKPTYTGAETVSENVNCLYFDQYPIINTSHNNSGTLSIVSGTILRNINGASADDSGTLAVLRGSYFGYGHYNSNVSATPQTTNVYGIYLYPYYKTGTISNLYDIFIKSDSTGGTVTTAWSYYQENTRKNYFGGNIGRGITPTAGLHLAAGSATAGTAPLKLTSGTLLSSPEAGSIEYLSGTYYATNAVPSRLRFVLRDDAAGVQGDILYHNGTNWTALGYGTSGYYLKTQGAGANPVWAEVTVSGGISTPDTPAQGDVLYYNGSAWKCLVAGTSGQLLKTQGAGANPVWATVAGTGDVVGPASNTDNYVPQWNGADSKVLKNGYPVSATAAASTIVVSDGSSKIDTWVSDASDTVKGKVELATSAETTTGTDATRAVTPDGLAGSEYGKQIVGIQAFESGTNTATGDGIAFFRIPPKLNGYNLVSVAACVYTAGTTGTTDIQIRNKTDSQDMLSTKITIDSGETDTLTAATAAVINTSYDDVATGDLIAIDVDAISTTPAKGLYVELVFQLP